MTVDVGTYGKQSVEGIFSLTNTDKCLEKNIFNVSSNECVPSTDISTLFVLGDDAYSLKINLLNPYSRLNLTGWMFNYWMSRDLRCIECAFSILVCFKWRCLKTELQNNPEHVGILLKYIVSSEFSAQGQVLHCKCMKLDCCSAEDRSSTANSGTKTAVLRGLIGVVAFRCFPKYYK